LSGSIWELKQKAVFKAKKVLKGSSLPAQMYMLRQRLTRHGSKRAVFFPDTMTTGSSGDLRVEAMAKGLEKFDWRVIVVPNWLDLETRMKILKREKPHVILFQQSRHPLNRPALYPGFSTIYDVDDADYVGFPEIVSECCRTASVSVVGNHHLEEVFRNYGAVDPQVVWTTTYIHSVPDAKPNEERQPVISWAHSHPEGYPIEAALVLDVLKNIAKQRKFIFRIYSDNPTWTNAYVAPLKAEGIGVEVYGSRRYTQFVSSLGTVAIGLHPVILENKFSRGKSFGKLLAYMAADVAVVTSNEVDHPLFFRHGENGMLVRTVEEWTEACLYLLDNPAERGRIAREAKKDFMARLTTHAGAAMMDKIMSQFVTRQG
jgi:glycosyltransferase involved in cell wall biosynthesis